MSDTTPSFSASNLYRPDFPPRWQAVSLHRLATWINGGAFRGHHFTGRGLPVVKIAEVKNGITGQTKFTDLEFDGRWRISSGDMIFSWSGQPQTSIGAFWWVGGPGWLNQHLFKVEPDRTVVDRKFFFYVLHYLRPQFVAIASNKQTTGLGHVTKSDLQAMTVRVPILSEQRRIAGVLGAFDHLIDTNTQLAARVESLAVALLDGATGSVSLSDVAEPVKSSLFQPAGGVEHYSLPAFDAGGLPELIDGSAIKSGKQRVTVPAVLVSRLNPQTPRVWMAYPSGEAAASTEFVVLAGKADVAVEEVWATCSTDSFAAEMRSRVTGTTGSHQRVDKAAIPAIDVSDPRSLRSVEREAVVSLVQEGQASREEAARLARTRDELLPLLMSGRITVDEAWEAVS